MTTLEADLVTPEPHGIETPAGTPTDPSTEPPAGSRTPDETTFRRLLVNTLVSGVTSSFLWFALTFWVYLETRSVVATGVISGSFALSSAVLGPYFGTFVDRHRKHHAMMVTTSLSLVCFAVATLVFLAVPGGTLLSLTHPAFWVLVGATLLGSVAGNMRGIALSTCVTLLVPESRRDKANGMVGTVTGISFAITSVFSGLVIGGLGMGWAYYGSVVIVAAMLVHLRSVSIDEAEPVTDPADSAPTGHVDIRGALDAIRAVPGSGC
jgi:DHA3 family multidrug efflux protein-like MFS transporter